MSSSHLSLYYYALQLFPAPPLLAPPPINGRRMRDRGEVNGGRPGPATSGTGLTGQAGGGAYWAVLGRIGRGLGKRRAGSGRDGDGPSADFPRVRERKLFLGKGRGTGPNKASQKEGRLLFTSTRQIRTQTCKKGIKVFILTYILSSKSASRQVEEITQKGREHMRVWSGLPSGSARVLGRPSADRSRR